MQEIWKAITDYENLYEVSNIGRVKNIRTGRILKPGIDRYGYYNVGLCKNGKQKTKNVHRLVAQEFLPNPDNLPCVNHKDENKLNNRVDNIEWCTVSYNNKYGNRLNKCRNSMMKKENNKPIAQFTFDLPCELIKVWPSLMEIERQLGYSAGNIWSCCNGKYKQAYGYQWAYWEE